MVLDTVNSQAGFLSGLVDYVGTHGSWFCQSLFCRRISRGVHTFDKPVANLVPLWSQSGHQCELVARLQDAVADGYFVVDLPVR